MKLYRFTLYPKSAMGTPLVGDTLFGQLCWAVRNRFGEARLTVLLEGYREQRPFMVVSDAFPQGFFPLPSLPSSFWKKLKHDRKQLKKAQFIKIDDAQKNNVISWQEYALSEYLKLQEKMIRQQKKKRNGGKQQKINSITPLIAKRILQVKDNLPLIQQSKLGLVQHKNLTFTLYLMKYAFHWKNYNKS